VFFRNCRTITLMSSEFSADSRNRNSSFVLLGGRLAIDFVNTAPDAAGASDALTSWGDLVAFLVATGTISLSREATLRDLVMDAELETSALRSYSLQLRTAIRQILEARISGYALDTNCIAIINGILEYTEGYEQLEAVVDAGIGEPDWRMTLVSRSHGMEWLIAAIARSAAKLVAEGPAAPVRICANPKCGLFFYDDSRTGDRKWCSMAACGNRTKVATHFRRRKGGKK